MCVLADNSNIECSFYFLSFNMARDTVKKIIDLLKSQFSFSMIGEIGIQLSLA